MSEVTSSVGGTDLLDHLAQANGLAKPPVSTLTKADVQYAQDSIGSPDSDAASKIVGMPTEISTDAVATSKKGSAEGGLGEKNGAVFRRRRWKEKATKFRVRRAAAAAQKERKTKARVGVRGYTKVGSNSLCYGGRQLFAAGPRWKVHQVALQPGGCSTERARIAGGSRMSKTL